jgi:HK97 family phage portal protein
VEAQEGEDYESWARIYKYHTWVAKAININANNFSAVPVQVVDSNGEALEGHPVTALFQYVNPALSPGDLWRSWMLNMQLAGEEFLETLKNNRGVPKEIWPRRPDRMGVVPDEDRKGYLGVAGYKWKRGEKDIVEFEPNDVIHFKFWNPLEPYRGLRPIAAVRNGILIDVFSQAWTKWFFKNQARPDFAIESEQALTTGEMERQEAWINEYYRGTEKTHRPILLEKGQKIIPLNFSPKDTEWLEQRKFSRDEIGAIFGVPDELMGFGRDTWENYRVAMEAYWRLTMLPLLRHRDDTATKRLRDMGALRPSERLASDLSDVAALQKNINEQIEGAERLWAMGTPPNLAFERVGLDLQIPGGDVGYIPIMLQSLGGEGPPPPAQEAPKAAPAQTKQARIEYDGPQHQAMWKAFVGLTGPREKTFKRELKRQFQRQQNEVGRRLREQGVAAFGEAAHKVTIEPLIDPQAEEAAFVEAFTPHFQEILTAGGMAALAELGLDVDFVSGTAPIQDMIEQMVIRFAQEVNATTIDKLREQLAVGAAEGEGIPQLMERLSQVFNGRKSDYETERIARTEVNKAANAGHVEGYKQAGVQEKEWMAALDNRTRETHVAAHGQRQPLNADFDVGGEYLNYPGDPKGSPENIIFCRCRVVAGI